MDKLLLIYFNCSFIINFSIFDLTLKTNLEGQLKLSRYDIIYILFVYFTVHLTFKFGI